LYSRGRLSPHTRAFLVSESTRIGVSRAARNLGTSRRTVYRWRRRAGAYEDRSCRPHRSPRQLSPQREAALVAARLERRWGPDRLGPALGIAPSTAYAALRRYRAERLRVLFPEIRPTRGTYPVLAPGELVAIDIKSLGRLDRGGGRRAQQHRAQGDGVGWRHLHVAIDMASRLVFTQLRPGLGSDDSAAFVRAAVAAFDARGIRVRRVLTDNGTGYKVRFASTCRELGVRHTKTKPHHPWTNGRVERFIRTIQGECLYSGEHFTNEDERGLATALFVSYYNAERPHTALGGLSPERWLSARGVTQVPEAYT
jgi:transposase InsO family protein